MTLEQVLAKAKDGSPVQITLVSNQNNGIASYAEGSLIFHPQTGGTGIPGPPLRPAHMESASPAKMYFSDRRLAIDPVPVGGFGVIPRQPFNANATEPLSVAISVGLSDHKTISVSIKVFGNTAKFTMDLLGDLYVGVGPSLSQSSGAVFVLAFTGVADLPH